MCFGLAAINIFRVGDGVNADPSTIETSESAEKLITTGESRQWWEFITHLVPEGWARSLRATSCRSSSWRCCSVSRLNAVGHIGGPVLDLINRVTQIIFKILNYDEAGAAGCVRRDGVCDRQVRGVHADQPGLADPVVLRDFGAVRVRGLGS